LNFARLNHLLVPSTKTGRDQFRTGKWAWLAKAAEAVYRALTREGRFLLVFWLICGGLGLQVRVTQVHLLWCAITGAFVTSLMLRRFFRLEAVTVRIEAPERIAQAEVIHLDLVVSNEGNETVFGMRVEGPLLPWDGQYVTAAPVLAEIKGKESVRLRVAIRFLERGEHHLDPFVLSRIVPLGLVAGRNLKTKGIRFLVLPRVAKLQQLNLPMNMRHQPGGVALASQTGESRELGGLRPYRPGDPVRDLHHRAWARYGVPVVREYQQEYFTRVGVVLDTDVTVASEEFFESGISLAAGVLSNLSRGEALIDLLVMGSELHQLTLGRHLGFLEQGLDLLSCVTPSAALHPERLLAMLSPHLSRLSSIVFIALHWDEDRQRLADEIRRSGTGLLVLCIADQTDIANEPLRVSQKAISQGEAIAL
jgi:uncharacterized protein (DUF58 family)